MSFQMACNGASCQHSILLTDDDAVAQRAQHAAETAGIQLSAAALELTLLYYSVHSMLRAQLTYITDPAVLMQHAQHATLTAGMRLIAS